MKPLEKTLFALLFLAATLLVMLAVGSGSASAETLTVDDDGGGLITGFETVTLIGAIGLTVILFGRKKGKLKLDV